MLTESNSVTCLHNSLRFALFGSPYIIFVEIDITLHNPSTSLQSYSWCSNRLHCLPLQFGQLALLCSASALRLPQRPQITGVVTNAPGAESFTAERQQIWQGQQNASLTSKKSTANSTAQLEWFRDVQLRLCFAGNPG